MIELAQDARDAGSPSSSPVAASRTPSPPGFGAGAPASWWQRSSLHRVRLAGGGRLPLATAIFGVGVGLTGSMLLANLVAVPEWATSVAR